MNHTPEDRLNLSNLTVQVVLDHAGGHARSPHISHCCRRRPLVLDYKQPPRVLKPVPWAKEGQGFHPAPSSPTRMHNKKKYIGLPRTEEEASQDDSQGKQQNQILADVLDPDERLPTKRGIMVPHSPTANTMVPRRFSLDSTFRPRKGVNVVFSNNINNKPPLSPTRSCSRSTTTTTENDVSPVRPRPRSLSLLALRQFRVDPTSPLPQGKQPPQRRRWSADVSTIKSNNDDDDSPSHPPHKQKGQHHLPMDSPTGSYKWPPKGYRALLTHTAAPDLCSVTSSSTYSSQAIKTEY